MNNNTKKAVAFLAGSLIDLADMAESDLSEVVELVGVNAIRDLMGMDHLRAELTHEQMADEICTYTGWEPMLAIPPWTDEELSVRGRQIADLVEGENPLDEDAAETLFAVLTWCGLGAWLEANDVEEPV